MWERTHSATFRGLDRNGVWRAWANVNDWHLWDRDIEWARLDTEFEAGAMFVLKPRGGPRVRIRFDRVEKLAGYTDVTNFPLARMYGVHDMADTADGLRLTITIRIVGPLAFLWRRLVAEKVAAEAPSQMRSLAAYVMASEPR